MSDRGDSHSLFEVSTRIEEQYHRDLSALIDRFHHVLLGFGLTDPNDIVRLLMEFTETEYFKDFALKAAGRMVTMTAVENAKDWREAARLSSRGRMIYAALQREMQGSVGMTVKNLVDENARLISTFPLDVAERANRFILKETQKGIRAENIATDLLEQFPDISKSRAKLIARTEAAKANTALVEARSDMLGLAWYVWRNSRDARVRDSHRWVGDRGGVLCAWKNPPNPKVLAGSYKNAAKESDFGPYHPGGCPNCFPGSAEVNLTNGCDKLWKRSYIGCLIEIILSDSTCCQATPNHPILTTKGWLSINDVQEGDNLIHCFRESGHISEADQNKFVTRFDNFFDSLSRFLPSETTSGHKLDFHGDGIEDDVHVINIDRLLSEYFVSVGFEGSSQLNLTGADSLRSKGLFNSNGLGIKVVNRMATPESILSFSNQFFAFLWTKFRETIDGSCTAVAARDHSMSKNLSDSSPTAWVDFRQGKLTFSPDIPTDYLFLWKVVLHRAMNILGYGNVPDAESLSNSFGINTEPFCNGVDRFSLSQKPLKVIEKRVSNFSGHVYNLQSISGWYSVTPTDIIVKNCRCNPRVLLDLEDIEWPHRFHDGSTVRMITRGEFVRMNGNAIAA